MCQTSRVIVLYCVVYILESVNVNSTHYLLQCQRFTAQRDILLDSMVPLLPPNIQCSTNLLLYGHTDLSLETNTLIFQKRVYIYQIHKTL